MPIIFVPYVETLGQFAMGLAILIIILSVIPAVWIAFVPAATGDSSRNHSAPHEHAGAASPLPDRWCQEYGGNDPLPDPENPLWDRPEVQGNHDAWAGQGGA